MTATTKTRKATEITAATVNRANAKDGTFLGYAVKSNKTSDYYSVTFNAAAARYECNCAAFSKCCHIKAVEQVQAARVASAQDWTPVSQPKTEADANLQAEWGSPVYDEAHYTAKFARADAMNAAYNRQLTPIQCKDGLYVPEDAPTFEKMDRAAYDAIFDPSGLAFL